jgi:hypothetical protein
MSHAQRALERIKTTTDPKALRNLIQNARKMGELEVANAAQRRLFEVLPQELPGTLEHDFWRTILAFEELLKDERGKTVRLSRTRQKVARAGVVKTLIDWALNSSETEGFSMLQERGLLELSGEAIVVRHRELFDVAVVAAASTRLEKAGFNTSSKP